LLALWALERLLTPPNADDEPEEERLTDCDGAGAEPPRSDDPARALEPCWRAAALWLARSEREGWLAAGRSEKL
jgi:hypothetical protein